MAECVEREAVYRAFFTNDTLSGYEKAYCKEIIKKIPAADVAPVRHGEWIVCGDGDNVPWMCSHCGKTTAHKYKVMYGKYCPNCGAKMDLEG